jgi:hypothetical protein
MAWEITDTACGAAPMPTPVPGKIIVTMLALATLLRAPV